MYNRYCCNGNGYIQHKNLKRYCKLCLDINKRDAVQPIIIEDERGIRVQNKFTSALRLRLPTI